MIRGTTPSHVFTLPFQCSFVLDEAVVINVSVIG